MLSRLPGLVFLFGASLALSEPTEPLEERAAGTATVILPFATILGNVKNKVESFGGIPYAEPPEGQLRLRPPKRLERSLGVFDATGPAGACPQMLSSTESTNILFDLLGTIANLPFVQKATGQSEDCLTITVARPEGTKAGAKLPVLYWIFGGGFQYGVGINQPFIFVAVNYRVAGFGFMPGKEILEDGAGNIGLLDQRMGLEWVADNIATFGGDPTKVTIWGESAGAISVFDQLALFDGDHTYKGKPLFRGAIMNSGGVAPSDPLDSKKGQAVYDQVVKTAGCTGTDSLNCLRELDYSDFLDAVTSVPGILSYSSLALSYLPRPDGRTLTASPDSLVLNGKYAAVPMIIGNQEDEGTLFSLFQANLTSNDKLADYLQKFYFNSASKVQLKELIGTYGDGLSAITQGSPFRSGIFNEIFPGFKKRAALLGDLVFTLSRRLFLQVATGVNRDVPSWAYMGSYNQGTPILGTFHASDLIQVFYGIKDNYAARSIRSYYLNFVTSLDPNIGASGKYPNWPQWKNGHKLMQFFADKATIINDDFRTDSYDWIAKNIGSLKI
ncbi:hypothetical protein QQZ08_001780 [Neonectria magnoliae]|uniref:Carboxylic ester hydrolase n=1 Tax=Neonectria magnoliae TaxID=2732573 RepID=A0ABR1ID80_9HYPO